MTEADKTLVLITDSYPYDAAAEGTFVEPELQILRSVFKKVKIIPASLEGTLYSVNVPADVDEIFARQGKNVYFKLFKKYAPGIFSSSLWRELVLHPWLAGYPEALKRLIMFEGRAAHTYHYMRELIERKHIQVEESIFYTYWLGGSTHGLGLLKKKYPGLKLVSRAHGADLYETRYKPSYIPCQKKTLDMVDKLFLVSGHGKHFISHKYPDVEHRCHVARLGVRDPRFLSRPSDDSVIRVLSCSYMVAVKRLALMLKGVVALAGHVHGKTVEWMHIGDGPLRGSIEDAAQKVRVPNFTFRFFGRLRIDEVYKIFKEVPVDVFLNTSQHEGIPVTIMEAMSCGTPVVATTVGGTPEIVNSENGMLLPANPAPEEIAAALHRILSNRDFMMRQRENSRKTWMEKYNADKNYKEFATRLISLFE